MKAIAMHRFVGAGMVVLTAALAGCSSDYVRDQGRAPAQVVILSMAGAQGSTPDKFFSALKADVVTNVTKPDPCSVTSPCPTVFNDLGHVEMSLILKDQGPPAQGPSVLNQITFTRYHVVYRRTDGHNTPGVDVPFAFDGASTFTVPASGTVTGSFELVRNDAKREAPLLALRVSPVVLDTIADVTFYGRDQVGNEVAVTGSLSVSFADFGDVQ